MFILAPKYAYEAETLVAGGEPIARLLQGVMNTASKLSYAPSKWRGGRLVELYKGKGDPALTDNSRGLLIADHSSKIFTGLLRDRFESQYMSYIPKEQFGCAAGRGTIFATHLLRSFIDHCNLVSASFFVLFVDLSKAFDVLIREILLSWRQGFSGDKVEHLMSIGLSRDDASTLHRDLQSDGGLLEFLGCDPSVCELINSLHTNSWFQIGNSEHVIVSNRGGRQGCEIGGHIFNMIYSRALHSLKHKMRKHGILLHVKSSEGIAFWSDYASASSVDVNCDGAEEVSDATFVDDECIFITASSPASLDSSIEFLLTSFISVFGASGFVINWAKGKTEALLKYRGKNASKHLEARCEDATVRINLPNGSSATWLSVAREYRRLGSVVSTSGSLAKYICC